MKRLVIFLTVFFLFVSLMSCVTCAQGIIAHYNFEEYGKPVERGMTFVLGITNTYMALDRRTVKDLGPLGNDGILTYGSLSIEEINGEHCFRCTGNRITLPIEKLNQSAGSIYLRVRWDGQLNDPTFQFGRQRPFTIYGKGKDGVTMILDYRSDPVVLSATYNNYSMGKQYQINAKNLDWDEGSWHELFYTWDTKKGATFYIDGKFIGQADMNLILPPDLSDIGVHIGGTQVLEKEISVLAPWNGLVAEFLLTDYVLSLTDLDKLLKR